MKLLQIIRRPEYTNKKSDPHVWHKNVMAHLILSSLHQEHFQHIQHFLDNYMVMHVWQVQDLCKSGAIEKLEINA